MQGIRSAISSLTPNQDASCDWIPCEFVDNSTTHHWILLKICTQITLLPQSKREIFVSNTFVSGFRSLFAYSFDDYLEFVERHIDTIFAQKHTITNWEKVLVFSLLINCSFRTANVFQMDLYLIPTFPNWVFLVCRCNCWLFTVINHLRHIILEYVLDTWEWLE